LESTSENYGKGDDSQNNNVPLKLNINPLVQQHQILIWANKQPQQRSSKVEICFHKVLNGEFGATAQPNKIEKIISPNQDKK
jgi:hypothetical protein